MVVCPVCEHAQASGDACDACGMALAPPAAPLPVEAPPLDGLEPTRADAVDAGVAAPFEGLEPTAIEPALAGVGESAGGQPPDWLDETRHRDTAAAATPLEDLEPTRVETPSDSAPDPFAVVSCRYCRTAAAPGDVFCERCGMKLTLYRPADRPPSAG